MDRSEFDKFADEYRALLESNIKSSGESPEFFFEYKIIDISKLAKSSAIRKNAAILDFGAGIGNSIPYVAKHLPTSALTCADVSVRSLDVARERFGEQARYVAFDGKTLPFEEGTFDIVFAACVFHHIPHGEHPALLREIRRVLRAGGMAVIFEHNPNNPLTVRAVNTCPFDENAVLIKADTLRGCMKAAGFNKPHIKYRIFFPAFAKALRPLESWMTWIPLGAQYYVVGTKH
jgi:ubiquinone/menaquinone biosynthesis C-methylase UbiE